MRVVADGLGGIRRGRISCRALIVGEGQTSSMVAKQVRRGSRELELAAVIPEAVTPPASESDSDKG